MHRGVYEFCFTFSSNVALSKYESDEVKMTGVGFEPTPPK